MKAIFLDNDGVMCLSDQWGTRDKKIKKWKMKNDCPSGGEYKNHDIPASVRMDSFDIKAVKVLNSILEETDAEIVVSSDWKLHCTLDELKQMFSDYGVIKQPIAVTPNHVLKSMEELESTRVAEINDWLSQHPEVEKWVAIDDLDLSALECFVHTKKMNQGIKQSGIKEKILKHLK